jgi:fumarate hydratase subunit alpha
MRKLDVRLIKDQIKSMFMDMNYNISPDLKKAMTEAVDQEDSELAGSVLSDLLKNAEIAGACQIPMCQDTGMAVVFIDIGQEVELTGGFVGDAIHQGVREAYEEGYLRKSVVRNPLDRVNTKDNTPAIIHYELIPGDKVQLTATAKGFGSENMSRLKMLNPSDGMNGVVDFVLETVKIAGPNPCPPMVVGVGIGGTMEKAALLAKRALTRDIGQNNSDRVTADLERLILEKVNQLNIGPQGFGGKTTAFAVNINMFPTHFAGLPVAVNINCHASRHREVTL